MTVDPSERRLRVPVRAALPWTSAHLATYALIAIVGAGALLRFWKLGQQSFWYDESVTAWLLRASPGDMLSALPHSESTPPLYYLVAWGWVRIFGNTDVGLRSLSALAGVGTVPVAYAAARSLAGRRVGLVTAAIVATSPLLVWYSQEARSYSLLVLTTALTLWLMARARERPTPGRLFAWALSAALALTTHYFSVFAIAPEAIILLSDGRRQIRWRLAAVAAVGATGLALFALAMRQSARPYHFADLPLTFRMRQVVREVLVGFSPPAGRLELLAAGAAVAVGLLLLVRRTGAAQRRGAMIAAAVAGATAGVPALMAIAGVDYLNTRNIMGAIVPGAIVVAAGLGARRAGWAGLAATGVLLAVSIWLIVAVHGDPLAQRAPWRQVAAALSKPAGAKAILLQGNSTWARPLALYMPHTWWMRPRGASVAEIDVLRRIATPRDCGSSWWGATCHVGPRAALSAPPAAGFRLVSKQRVTGFEIARYRSDRPRHLYPKAPFDQPKPANPLSRRALLVRPAREPPVP